MAAPARRRPGAESPIKLPVEVEPVRTPATATTEAHPSTPPSDVRDRTAAPGPAQLANLSTELQFSGSGRGDEPGEPDRKTAVTVQIRDSLRRRAQTAVLRTAGLPGGPRSFTALVDAALARELEALEATFNDGQPFEQNQGAFRTGRPFAN